jgi:RNA polymerase-binding transcription factor
MPEDAVPRTIPNLLDSTARSVDRGPVGPALALAEGEPGTEGEPGAGGEEAPATRSPEAAIDEVDRLLDAIEAALAALDDGSYGTCRTCGSAIESSRLDADPLVGACGSCDAGPTAGPD